MLCDPTVCNLITIFYESVFVSTVRNLFFYLARGWVRYQTQDPTIEVGGCITTPSFIKPWFSNVLGVNGFKEDHLEIHCSGGSLFTIKGYETRMR